MNLLGAVTDFLREDGWNVISVPPEGIVETRFRGSNGQWNCFAQIRAGEMLLFYSVFPEVVPVHARARVSEYVCRANYGLPLGNFEIDLDDGTVRYKTSIDVGEDPLSPTLIRQVVYANVVTMNKYYPGIAVVLAGDDDPGHAIATIEGGGKR